MSQEVLVRGIGVALIYLIWIIEILLVIRAFLSWFPGASTGQFGRKIDQLTEPIILPFRRLVSRSVILASSMIDVSFLVTIIVLEIVKRVIAVTVGV